MSSVHDSPETQDWLREQIAKVEVVGVDRKISESDWEQALRIVRFAKGLLQSFEDAIEEDTLASFRWLEFEQIVALKQAIESLAVFYELLQVVFGDQDDFQEKMIASIRRMS